jgi:hypothetical protein
MRSSMLALLFLVAVQAFAASPPRRAVLRSLAATPDGIGTVLPPDPIAAPLTSTVSLPEDAAWEGFVTPASNGHNAGFIEFHGKLVLQNSGLAGSLVSPYLATWDGTTFKPLPPLGPSPSVSVPSAMGIWNDHLIVAASGHILMLDGSVWDTLGTANSIVWALKEYQGHLIAGGRFASVNGVAAPLVAAYDGASWSAAGTGFSTSSEVTGLAVHGGSLVAVGSIGALNGVASLAALGGAWQMVGAGFTGGVQDATSDGVDLYVSGKLVSSGGVTMGGLARWDGTKWNSTGGPTNLGVPEQSLTQWNGKIVTTFPPVVPSPTNAGLSQWDGVSLTTIPGDSIGSFSGGSASRVGTWGTKLVVTGSFVKNGSVPVPSILVYDGVQWSTVSLPWGPGMTGPTIWPINDMRSWGGKLIVSGGFFLLADQDHWLATRGISAWDGAHWSPLGSGLRAQSIWLGEYGGDLVAFGYDMSVQGAAIQNVARWNGSTWSALGSNAPNFLRSSTSFLGDLYVGSDFYGLSRWNGTAWTQVAGTTNVGVEALATAGGNLVAGGYFSTADGLPSPNVAFWDGTSWHAAGAGVNDGVQAAAEWLGQPIIGGPFTASGATPLPGVAIWDGSAWQPMGTRAVEVYSLRVLDGELFATGEFRLPDDSVAETIAHWTGTDWHVLGSGSNGSAFASYGGYLYQSGYGLVHGHPSQDLSRVPLSAVLDVPRPSSTARGVALSASPNPSRTLARFSFTLPTAGRARLTVIDLAGRVVATLADGPLDAGDHQVRWTTPAPAGVYFARLDAPGGLRQVVRVVRFE